MVEEIKNENQNVQQTQDSLTGQVGSQASVGDAIVGEGVNMPTEEERQKAERLATLDGQRIMTGTEVKPIEPSLSVDGVSFFALGDIHGLKAKQKQGKTTALKVMAAALLRGSVFRVKSMLQSPVVLWLDTEQQPADVKRIIDDVKQLTGLADDFIDAHLRLYHLRKLNYETLLSDTRLLIESYTPQVVVIDGVVDYVQSFNDEVMSRQLIHDLMVISEDEHCAIINVLHENKAADDFNMRGHLGTVLAQAAGTVLECRKSKQGVITVSCSDPRHGIVPPWSFRFDAEGRIVDADALRNEQIQKAREDRQQQRQAEREKIEQERLATATRIIREHGGSITRSDLTKSLEEQLKMSRPSVSKFLTQQVKSQHLYEAGKVITETPETVMIF